jgi:hypothetical protein
MLRVVLDTNVLISALIRKGKPRKLLRRAYEKRFILILSREMMEEFLEVCGRDYFHEFVSDDEAARFSRMLVNLSQFVAIKSKFKVISEDPSDDIIINTAIDGGAEYIVSGDEHLLALGEFRGIRMVSVSKMLKLLEKGSQT